MTTETLIVELGEIESLGSGLHAAEQTAVSDAGKARNLAVVALTAHCPDRSLARYWNQQADLCRSVHSQLADACTLTAIDCSERHCCVKGSVATWVDPNLWEIDGREVEIGVLIGVHEIMTLRFCATRRYGFPLRLLRPPRITDQGAAARDSTPFCQ